MSCTCYKKEVLLQQDAIDYAFKLRTVYSDPIIVLKAEKKKGCEVLIVTSFCVTHTIMYLLPKYFPNVVLTI
ncbi:hypothetical protein CD32_20770 [Lysinibacillus odysseyi 34hs-1 = NBRC 100172]|uniref:Uncharacterized protein n=1 Tax=Lysinibacillus odysseyi 34hs-1 = NBRC 100172 TaxID=1220589 RepID=A0A0A3IEC6_9BACI|nr:hypothetical protein CD32_20770 [Lysinibacillus odysseyi 34hs-1 = NBRC 100172]